MRVSMPPQRVFGRERELEQSELYCPYSRCPGEMQVNYVVAKAGTFESTWVCSEDRAHVRTRLTLLDGMTTLPG